MPEEKTVKTEKTTKVKSIRLWPGIVIVIIQWFLWAVLPALTTDDSAVALGILGGMGMGLPLAIWWLVFSRTGLKERITAPIVAIPGLALAFLMSHVSIRTGLQGMMYPSFAIPSLCIVFVAALTATRKWDPKYRRKVTTTALLITLFCFLLIRSDGITGQADIQYAFRWAQTAEEKLLEQETDIPAAATEQKPLFQVKGSWPGFRGENRDSVVTGISINTDWKTSPPQELWRRPIGPGCSSFAIKDSHFYTQEQRGEQEIVSCYSTSTGSVVWRHGDKNRFYDSHAGAGPRSTPVIYKDAIYTLGPTGILNALTAEDGKLIWSRNAAEDTKVKIPHWALCGSPLVVDDTVIISTEGSLAGYDRKTGEPKWQAKDGGAGYSSPHLYTIDGTRQVLLMSQAGALSVNPSDGTVLWEHLWKGTDRILQPAFITDNHFLLPGSGNGMQRVTITKEKDAWSVKEIWTSKSIRPSWNDSVVHKGYGFGFHGKDLACIDLGDGKRLWKGGKYAGHLLLLADQGIIIVLSEKGELALVEAKPDGFNELAKIQAIEGKTWNLPALVGDILLVRNAQEMAAFRLETI